MSQPEDTDEMVQYSKIVSAAILLSLDSFVPFYPYLDVPAPTPDSFKTAIRAVILENRATFDIKNGYVPDLRRTIDRILFERLGYETVHRFDWWYKNIFIEGPGDYRVFSRWKRVLLGAKNIESEWADLRLPLRISESSKTHFLKAIDRTEITAIYEKIYEMELSEWDLDMYTRHGLDDEFADPWMRIRLIFSQLQYRKFMGWLLSQLSPDEQDAFHLGATQVAVRHNETEPGTMLPHPITQILPDAHAFS
ncbi:MAG TPA: hypothetical protein PK677_13925 [Acidiphilium sp.]|uniref:hypothetical protein n=1 Tax=Acidiphilium sp. TaxID=527 RepID=UPI000BD091E9|nr:hypothetical protein [Acidiphilium sp.]OZB39384.1 MAG: hypothetical protein B7X48_09260 [Acidiphilium sp. 34-60-192]HQT89626.1 hypothetical protein [Acidiphilium sp.]